MARRHSGALSWLMCAALGLLAASMSGQAPLQAPSEGDPARVARLAGMGRLWGMVKFFHPYLAYRSIDWDRALVEAIPLVDGARTPEEYQAAIERLLSALGDPATRAELDERGKNVGGGAGDPKGADPVTFEGRILRVDATRMASVAARDQGRFGELLTEIQTALPQSNGVVLDLRKPPLPEDAGDFGYWLGVFESALLKDMLRGTVTLSTRRYRIHNGYPPQSGTTSGGYSSVFAYAVPRSVVGERASPTPRLVVLVSEQTEGGLELAVGLRSAGLARIVLEGNRADGLGATMHPILLPDGLWARVRTSEIVGPDGRIGVEPDIVTAPGGSGEDAALERALGILREWPERTRPEGEPPRAQPTLPEVDDPYLPMTFPSREYRLLALFRFWNVIDLFYPYKALLDQPWDDVLPRFIPLFDTNMDAAAYHQTVRELVAAVQDSHGYVSGATAVARWYPPFNVRFLEGQTVVDFRMKDARGVRLWDSVLAVDGQPIADYRRSRSSTIAAATPQSLERKLHDVLFRGEKGSRMRLTVRGLDGKTREVSVVRSVDASDPRWNEIGTGLPERPLYEVLPGRIGYADLRRLERAQVDAMFEAITDTDAVIFDIRGYPHGTAWDIAPRLTDKTDVVGALFSRPFRDAIDLGNEEGMFDARYTFEQTIPPRRGSVYRGRVVVLIDATAISHAEHSCLFLEAAAPVTFIGMPTAGTNGDVTDLVLPGNLVVGFTGHDVRHADGRQLQRIGIQPTIRVEPTLRGFAEGRDEILEAALAFLRK